VKRPTTIVCEECGTVCESCAALHLEVDRFKKATQRYKAWIRKWQIERCLYTSDGKPDGIANAASLAAEIDAALEGMPVPRRRKL
jgi:hypothetical protein